jgi:hypothetical protein
MSSWTPAAGERRLGPRDPLLAGRTGRGVAIAVIDSGINAAHSHIGGIASSVAIDEEGRVHGDAVDRLGHGTAVAAAIHEKAPEAEIHVIRVFHESLSTNVEALVIALDTAYDLGARLVNMSLGTANPANVPALAEALERGRDRGILLLSASSGGGRTWYPGSLSGALPVILDESCPRECARLHPGAPLLAAASGFARPIPGVPPERNLNGVSFAVANTTGLVGRLLQGRPEITSVETLRDLVFGA